MDQQPETPALREYQRACKALAENNVLHALSSLEAALRHQDNPHWYSMLGFCIAKERGHVTRGSELCLQTLEAFPDEPDHYYYYGRLLLVTGRKVEAIQMLRQGLGHGGSPAIRQLLQELGLRKPPLIPWLHRDNPLNKYLGVMLAWIGLR